MTARPGRDRVLSAAARGFGATKPPDDDRDPLTRRNPNGSITLGPDDWERLKKAKGAALQ